MDDMEAKIGSVLENPELMQKIMAMAQAMNASSQKEKQETPRQDAPKQDTPAFSFPDIDLGMVQKLSGFAKNSGIDKNQKNLLHALGPYLSQERVTKLEKAMRAAKMARLASAFLGQSGLLSGTGR